MEPFVKWAGGKRQLLNEILELMPNRYNRYVEPFVGGGALFFALQANDHNPKRINDTNRQLINCYEQIRDNPDELMRQLDILRDEHNEFDDLEACENYYYHTRRLFNERILRNDLNVTDAARFIYLNKTCYNGLFRVNSTGLFNAPFGKKVFINLYSQVNILECSIALTETSIRVGDFEDACKYLRAGDFVFFDSPYYDTFDTYQSNGFSESDHKRLARLFRRLHRRGIFCMLTNSNTQFVIDLYEGFNIREVNVRRMISSDANTRIGTEVIITSYNNDEE